MKSFVLHFVKIFTMSTTKSIFIHFDGQAFEKVNMSPKLRKMVRCLFAKTMIIHFHNSVFGEIKFSQKSFTNRKKQSHTLPQQVPVQQTPILSCCPTTSPRSADWPK